MAMKEVKCLNCNGTGQIVRQGEICPVVLTCLKCVGKGYVLVPESDLADGQGEENE